MPNIYSPSVLDRSPRRRTRQQNSVPAMLMTLALRGHRLRSSWHTGTLDRSARGCSQRRREPFRDRKTLFPARISPEIVLFALAAGSALRQLSPCDYVRFWRWAASASMNLPSIKRAGSPHYTVIRLKTSFCSATYRPKERRSIYRELGALVHSKYLHHSVQHNALIVGTWSRSHGRTTKRAPDASGGTV
jgi:hypothetical protein